MQPSAPWDDYEGWLARRAGQLVGHYDCEDVMQEGRIAMWRAWLRFDPDRGVLPAWLTFKAESRMREVAAHRHTERNRRGWMEPSGADCGAVAIEGHATDRVAVGRALDTLTPRERAYVQGRFWGGLSERQLASRGLHPRCWRRPGGARDKLRNHLREV